MEETLKVSPGWRNTNGVNQRYGQRGQDMFLDTAKFNDTNTLMSPEISERDKRRDRGFAYVASLSDDLK